MTDNEKLIAETRAKAFKEARDAVNDWYIAAGKWGPHGSLQVLSRLQNESEQAARAAGGVQ